MQLNNRNFRITSTVYMGQFVFTHCKGFISQAVPSKFLPGFAPCFLAEDPKNNLCHNSLTSVVKNIEKFCLKQPNLPSLKF